MDAQVSPRPCNDYLGFPLSESVHDTHEGIGLKSGTADETAVHVGLGEKLLGVGGLAAATVEDRSVVGYFLAILFSDGVADESVHLLSLIVGSGLAGADCPYGLVSEHDLAELLG